MQNLSIRIKAFETGINKLIVNDQEKSQRLIIQADEIAKLAETINNQKDRIQQLEKQLKITDNQNTLDTNKEDQIKTKQLINEMMREIDKCLLLLDK